MLAACGGQAVYTGESFSSDSPFKLRTDGDVTLACESARRALLGQGYLIDSASSASVGVSALGSISLPIGQSADSLVKVSEETINDEEFYRRFFAAIRIIISEMQPTWKPPVSQPEPAPQPIEVPVGSTPPPVQDAPTAPVAPQTVGPAESLPPPVGGVTATAPQAPPQQVEPLPAEPRLRRGTSRRRGKRTFWRRNRVRAQQCSHRRRCRSRIHPRRKSRLRPSRRSRNPIRCRKRRCRIHGPTPKLTFSRVPPGILTIVQRSPGGRQRACDSSVNSGNLRRDTRIVCTARCIVYTGSPNVKE